MIKFNSIEMSGKTIKMTFSSEDDAAAFYKLATEASGNSDLVVSGDGVLRTLERKKNGKQQVQRRQGRVRPKRTKKM